MSQLAVDFALLQYGSVRVYDRLNKSDGAVYPGGELHPPMDHWISVALNSPVSEVLVVLRLARSELQTWKRRPEPPPEGETLSELKLRILSYEGWEAKDVALACRCTPTLVRRTRTEAERNPETGAEEGSLTHARELLASGMSLRQVAVLTGIPKSSLHRHVRAAAVPCPSRS